MITIRSSIGALILCSLVVGCSDDGSPGVNEDASVSSGGSNGTGGKGSGGSAGKGSGGAQSGGASGGGAGGKAGAGGKGTGGGSGVPEAGPPDASTDGGDGGGIPAAPKLGTQIDRMGRAAINTALNHTFDTNDTTKGVGKNAYNSALPATWGTFKGEFAKNLAILDSLDTNCGNQLLAGKADAGASRYDTLASVLTDDQLYVNATQSTCGVYLGVEAEAVGAVAAGDGKCGGRTPKDDVIARSYSVLAAGALAGVDDTITADEGAQTTTFPFLGPPTLPDGGN